VVGLVGAHLGYGGDSETSSGGSRTRNNERGVSCAENGKEITTLAAIVAPHTCDLVRGAPVLKHLRVPLSYLIRAVFFCLFLTSFLLPCPSPKCLSLYSFTLANPSLFQYRSRAPAAFSAIGCGIRPAVIHLRIVPRWTPSNLAVSEIENSSSLNLCTMMVCMSSKNEPG
jgi:hypothetical protein